MKAGKDLAAVAREMADSVTDPEIQATEVSQTSNASHIARGLATGLAIMLIIGSW